MWIWQSALWPQFSFDSNALQAALVAARRAQGRLLGAAEQLQLLDAGELQLSGWTREALATAQIEGEVLQLNSVRASAARRLGLVPDPTAHKDERRDERIEATLDVIQAATSGWQHALTHETLCGWQAALFPTGYSGITKIDAGSYRTHAEPMQIVTQRLGENDVIHYQAPESKDVPRQMKALLAWLSDGRISGKLAVTDGLIRAAIAHLWFEVIHPFEDGNGRIGRALAERCLAEDVQSELRLFSLSQQFLLDRSGYYDQLQRASKCDTTQQAEMDITDWIHWFLGGVEKACLASLAQLAQANAKNKFNYRLQSAHPDLSKSQRKVLFIVFDAQQTNASPDNPSGFSGGMSTEKYVAISGVSRATAYRELTDLVAQQLLTISGQGRGTRYALVS